MKKCKEIIATLLALAVFSARNGLICAQTVQEDTMQLSAPIAGKDTIEVKTAAAPVSAEARLKAKVDSLRNALSEVSPARRSQTAGRMLAVPVDDIAVQDEIVGFLVGRSVAAPISSDICSDAGDVLRRIGEGNVSARCDIRAVDVDEKGLREIRVIVKVGGVRRDPSDGLRLRTGSVKYDFLNGINCVYLTYASRSSP